MTTNQDPTDKKDEGGGVKGREIRVNKESFGNCHSCGEKECAWRDEIADS